MTKKMTQKQFREILEAAGRSLDYSFILCELERLAWLEAKDFERHHLNAGAENEKRVAQTFHAALEAAGFYK